MIVNNKTIPINLYIAEIHKILKNIICHGSFYRLISYHNVYIITVGQERIINFIYKNTCIFSNIIFKITITSIGVYNAWICGRAFDRRLYETGDVDQNYCFPVLLFSNYIRRKYFQSHYIKNVRCFLDYKGDI